MKRTKGLLGVVGVAVGSLGGTMTQAQYLKNPGFEVRQATTPPLPAALTRSATRGYRLTLDSTVAYAGRASLQLTGTQQAGNTSQFFSQRCRVQVDRPTAWRLRAMVKAAPGVRVALQCQVRSETKLLQTLDSRRWDAAPTGTGAWRQLELTVLLSPAVRYLVFGGSLTGVGQIWFDELHAELIPAETPCAPVVQAYVDSLVSIVRQHSLVRDSVPWPQTQAALRTLTTGMQTPPQAYAAAGYLLEVLRRYGDDYSRFVSVTALHDKQGPAPGQVDPLPVVKYLGGGIGYVSVPAFNAMNNRREVAFATHLQAQIRLVGTKHHVVGWIVDLRENKGGNLYPIVAGLGPLLGEPFFSGVNCSAKGGWL
jgi:hypothetical protein